MKSQQALCGINAKQKNDNFYLNFAIVAWESG